MLGNTENRYGLLSRAIHGIMLLLIFGMLGVGMYMADLDKTDELRKELLWMHTSTGVLVLMLAVVRVTWLKISPAPRLPVMMDDWEKTLTTLVKSLMYLLMLLIPIAGILIVNTKGDAVSFYGLFEVPMLTGENKELHELMEEIHELFAFSLLFLVILHIAGALKHRFFDMSKELDVMKRMFGK
ncbi:MAG: cytochrome b [Gammaproteobacteria bacterium]|nr:cytochrome b [Gammaproteobacteria bacterium]